MIGRYRALPLICGGVLCGGVLLTVIPLAVTRPFVQGLIEAAGANIPTDNVLSDYTWGLVWALLLLLSLALWPVPFGHKKLLAAAWIVKCFTALVLMLPYEEHYWGLDCWGYFQSAHGPLAELLGSAPRSGTDMVIAVSAILLRVGPDSYHAVKLSFAMCGLAAVYLFHRTAERLLGRSSPALFWILVLYPSILFWSSILGKDPLILLAIAIHVWGLANLAVQRRASYLWVSIAGILAVSSVRIWMGPILLAPSLLLIVSKIKNPAWRIVAIASIAVMLVTLGAATIDRLALQDAHDVVEATHTVTDGFGKTNSGLDTDVELNSTWDLVEFAPIGLFNTFFRPLPGDVDNPFALLAGIENTCLLLLAVIAAVRFRLRDLANPVFFWSIALLLTWGAAYSLIAHKDLGTAVRFKLQVLPILVGTIGYLLRRGSPEPARMRPRLTETPASGEFA